MNFLKFLFISIFMHLTTHTLIHAQSLLLGVRENQYIRTGYVNKKWNFILEHSMYVSSFKNQVLNVYIGHKKKINRFDYEGTLYWGVNYNKLFYNIGGICDFKYYVDQNFRIEVGIRPHYDSTYGYTTTYLGCLRYNIYKEIYIITKISNYPEYRTCEHRIKGGISLKVDNLEILPEISIPINNKIENIRTLISFRYLLDLAKL